MRVRGFGRASILERRNADLFFESLSGVPARGGRTHAEAYPQDEPGYDAFEDDYGGGYLEAPPTTTTVTTPARLTPSTTSSGTPPPGTTIYVDIRLGRERPATPMTGIYVPQGYRLPSNSQVDIVLYLHGHKSTNPGFIPPNYSVDQFWDRSKLSGKNALREGLDASGKNAILVVPTLGTRSYPGRLTSRGLDWYLPQVLKALEAYGNLATPAPTLSIRNLILSAHSGGGVYMMTLARSKATLAQKVREIWCFDSMYSKWSPGGWRSWARANPTGKVFAYYHSRSTKPKRHGLQLQRYRLPNVTVAQTTARGHHWVPIEHWQARLSGSTFLDPKSTSTTTTPTTTTPTTTTPTTTTPTTTPPSPPPPLPATPPPSGFGPRGSTYRPPPMDGGFEDVSHIGISADNRRRLAQALGKVLANSYTLYVEAHNFHWNVTGQMFQDLHKMFGDQYAELATAVDEIAERIRALGHRAPGTFDEFRRLSSIQGTARALPAMEMVRVLAQGHEAVIASARALARLAEEVGDQASLDLATRRLQAHEKAVWMLRSLLER